MGWLGGGGCLLLTEFSERKLTGVLLLGPVRLTATAPPPPIPVVQAEVWVGDAWGVVSTEMADP